MDEHLIEAFEACLQLLKHGQSLEACLLLYPDLADELRPRLNTVLLTRNYLATIQPAAASQTANKDKFLAQIAMLKSPKPIQAGEHPNGNHRPSMAPVQSAGSRLDLGGFISWLMHPLANNAIRIVAVLVVLVLVGAGTLSASAQSLPGTPLYGLKRAIEDTRLALAPNQSSRVQLQNEFSDVRMQEVQQVTGQGASVSVEFGGQLTRMEPGKWTVEGINVIVPSGIQIHGDPEIGLYVWVSGDSQADGTVAAKQISIEGTRLQGKVTEINGRAWRIGERVIFTSRDTRIEDNPGLGDVVEVNVWILPDGNWLAEEMHVLTRADDSPSGDHGGSSSGGVSGTEPTHTPGSGDNSNKSDQAISQPTSISSSQGGPGPSPSQTPDPSGASSKTLEPTRTPEPTRSPQPTKTSNSGGGAIATATNNAQQQEVRLQGALQSITGSTWVVAGQSVLVDGSTVIENNPQVGDTVEVRAMPLLDGSLLATRIRKK